MAISGWGLTPGSLEKNITRSLTGKYGAVGNTPDAVSDMVRQKYASGLQAKTAKETFDLAREAEANRKAEAGQQFGLETEKFGFAKEEAGKGWEADLRDYLLSKEQMTGDWTQEDLDRALRGTQLEAETGWRSNELAQRAKEAEMANRLGISQFQLQQRQYESGLAQQQKAYEQQIAEFNLSKQQSAWEQDFRARQQADMLAAQREGREFDQSKWEKEFAFRKKQYADELARLKQKSGSSGGSSATVPGGSSYI